MKRRRALLAALALGAAAPLTSYAQQPGRTYRVGLFLAGRDTAVARQRRVIVERLATHSIVEGRNLLVELRIGSFDHQIDAGIARELVSWRPDAILVDTSPLSLGTRKATATIPIVFTGVGDPVGSGLVKDFARPGGNATGVHYSQLEVGAKRLELLRDLLPGARRVLLVRDLAGPDLDSVPQLRQVASRFGLDPVEAGVSWGQGFAGVVAHEKPDGLISSQRWAFYGQEDVADQIIGFAAERRIPSLFWESAIADRGATLAYGVDPMKELGRATDQLARVLKSARPAELPVDQATQYELVVNLKAAGKLGITVPPSIRVRADRVIE